MAKATVRYDPPPPPPEPVKVIVLELSQIEATTLESRLWYTAPTPADSLAEVRAVLSKAIKS